MRSRATYILLVFTGLVAFAPVLAVDYVLDGYAQKQETRLLEDRVAAVTGASEASVLSGLASLARILDASPSLCTSTYHANVNRELSTNPNLVQVVVENGDGIQYCSAYDDTFQYRLASDPVTVPGRTESMSAVTSDGHAHPLLQITQSFGSDRTVSAFVLAAPLLAAGAGPFLEDVAYLELALTSGAPILFSGDDADLGDEALVVARSIATEIPIKATAGAVFSQLRTRYADLDFGLTIVACIVGAIIMGGALQLARRPNVANFDLERAIVAGEMKPYYQPVMDIKSGRLIGCEVLVRWVKRNGEVVPPGAFIDYAEMSGLAVPMTLSLMEQVRFDLEDLCREVRDFKVSINLFEGHFRDGSIVEDIESIFGDSGIAYRQLVFEITERRPFDDRVAATRVMSALHKLGVRIALDDAGTGHSNLAYLESLGIDIVKIDKIFIDMIKDAEAPVPVVDGLISMAMDMGIDIIAEGVETQEQALYLRSKKVYHAQGYLFAPPLKLSRFMALADALNPRPSQGASGRDMAA
ncbi:EAL domain-containing protein [Pelagibacterium montanilacus]|uniref:EAL domain-containing protein n=1 Tax=Pelagibacterium montanilacus TaxID=2185280 RepID=UPI000F8D7B06|nr:EAL domain-containing protein [Pelagibacterium montanilacus]